MERGLAVETDGVQRAPSGVIRSTTPATIASTTKATIDHDSESIPKAPTTPTFVNSAGKLDTDAGPRITVAIPR